MTEKQKRFCDEYLIDLNATQAAIRAGYAKNTASNACYWINEEADKKQVKAGRKSQYKPELGDYIAEYLEELHSQKTADAQEVMEYLTSVLRGESEAEEIVVEGCGDGVSEARTMRKRPSEKDRLKAAELLGKRFGLYTDKMELEAKDLELHITVDYGEAPDS